MGMWLRVQSAVTMSGPGTLLWPHHNSSKKRGRKFRCGSLCCCLFLNLGVGGKVEATPSVWGHHVEMLRPHVLVLGIKQTQDLTNARPLQPCPWPQAQLFLLGRISLPLIREFNVLALGVGFPEG